MDAHIGPDSLAAAFGRILSLRDTGDYECITVATPSGMMHQVVSPDLLGNLGNFSFVSEGKSYGEAIIASSAKTKYALEEYYEQEGITAVVVKALKDGCLWYEDPRLPAPDNGVVVPIEYQSDKTHDSEYILLNLLHHELTQNNIRNGTLQLITERIPCQSCTDVILAFHKGHKDIDIAVYYFVDTVSGKKANTKVRTSVDVLQQIGTAPIRLYKCVEQQGIIDAVLQA